MSFVVLIPARLDSTRLPNKPLADIGGLPMVVRVAQRAKLSGAARVIVVAPDQAIVNAVRLAGFEALLTRPDHESGTDRLAEACQLLGLPAETIVVNAQGDEPFIEPLLINAVAQLIHDDALLNMATACHPLSDCAEMSNPNVVKVVLDFENNALYFSRAGIPFSRDGDPTITTQTAELSAAVSTIDSALNNSAKTHGSASSAPLPSTYRHIGVYAYRAGFLKMFSQLSPAPIERLESLEQLRALWFGHRIKAHISVHKPAMGVDTPADLERARATFLEMRSNSAN